MYVRERTIRRAAERKAKKAAEKAARKQSAQTPQPPPAPAPCPETQPVSNHANATHNGTSNQLIVAGERLEDFQALTANLTSHFQPANPHEQALVNDLAHGRWMLWRRQRAFNAIEASVYAAQPDEAKWAEPEFKRLSLAHRYLTQAERAYTRALKNVEAFAKERAKTFRWEAMRDLALQRLQLQKAKQEFAVARSAKNAVSSPLPPQPNVAHTPTTESETRPYTP
jgi:hypothetical protein